MKATEQYFPVVLFIMLYKVVLTFESVDEILTTMRTFTIRFDCISILPVAYCISILHIAYCISISSILHISILHTHITFSR